MLRIAYDEARGAFLLEPSGPLTRADIAALTERFNAEVNAGDHGPNLVIHAASFPGWADSGAMLQHLRFIRGHQALIDKVALVSDARILELAPKVARHFISPQVRRFPAAALDEALDWVATSREARPAVTLIEGLPDDAIGISVAGVITARDYAERIVPLIDDRLKRHARISLLYRIGPEFEGFTSGALWSDARVGLMHLSAFAKVAVVSDIAWIRQAAEVFAPLVPAEIHVYADADLDQAKAWISTPGSEDAKSG